jgi:phosphate-selective porin OprO/OprP
MASLTKGHGRWLAVFVASAVCGLVAVPAPAEELKPAPAATPAAPTMADLERRIRELEEIVHRLEAERRQPAPPAATVPTQLPNPMPEPAPAELPPTGGGGPPSQLPRAYNLPADDRSGGSGDGAPPGALAGWDNDRGFFLRSQNGWFNLRLTGQLQNDYRAFLDGRDYTDVDTFLVRRARLGIEADLAQYYEFRLLPDFSNAQAPGLPGQTRIQDAYMNVHYWDAFQIETGKFKQPFSYEQLIQDRFVPTLERSLIDQFVPARDEGLMVHGYRLLGGRLDYGAAVSNGEINGDFDTNKQKDVNARVVVRPFVESEWLRGLQLGISGGTGVEDEPISPNPLRTPSTVPWLTFNANTRANGLRDRLSPEVVYFHGGLGLAAQYYREDQRMSPAFAGPGSQFVLDVPITGFYVLGTYLLTGEPRTMYSMPVKPLRPFSPLHGCEGIGAWELVGRVSRVNLGEQVFEPLPVSRTARVTLANAAVSTRGVTEMTLGFNWYLNAWVRVQFNWEHDWFDSPLRLGPGPSGLLTQQDALLTRLQFIF